MISAIDIFVYSRTLEKTDGTGNKYKIGLERQFYFREQHYRAIANYYQAVVAQYSVYCNSRKMHTTRTDTEHNKYFLIQIW